LAGIKTVDRGVHRQAHWLLHLWGWIGTKPGICVVFHMTSSHCETAVL
jgi:hypothetical protein